MSSYNFFSVACLHIGLGPGLSRADEIMFSVVFEIFVVRTHLQAIFLLTVLLLSEQLESVGGSMLAYVMSFIMVDETCIIWSCIFSSKNGDGKILRDAPGYIRVLIFRC